LTIRRVVPWVRDTVLAAVSCLFLVVSFATQAQQAASISGPCAGCHASGPPVPANHPKVKGTGIAECATCHASQAGQAAPHPMAARLHRAHSKVDLDCTTCHAFVPGKHFAVIGTKGSLGTLDVDDYERLRKAMASWANSPFLASTHGSKLNLSCGACHQKQLIPDDNEVVINKQCASCHGDYDKMAAISKAKLKNPNINPHGSHLGPEIACTACHQGHRESKPYCINCHTNFVMPIPGGAAAGSAATK